MTQSDKQFIPALMFDIFTPIYDWVQRWLVKDTIYKNMLIEQARIQPGHRVLDFGCGTGTLAIMVKQAQPQAEALGIDADPKMLSVAIAKAAEANLAVKFDVGMTFELPYPDNSIDRALSTLMVHHLKTPDKIRTAKEIHRVLKPGGELHILDFGKPSSFYGKMLRPLLHKFEEANDNIDGKLPEIFAAPGLTVREVGDYQTFFGTLTFLHGVKK